MSLKYTSVKPEGKLKFAQVNQVSEVERLLGYSYQFLGCSPKYFSGNELHTEFSTLGSLMVELTICCVGEWGEGR
jgi:hypothetical protein